MNENNYVLGAHPNIRSSIQASCIEITRHSESLSNSPHQPQATWINNTPLALTHTHHCLHTTTHTSSSKAHRHHKQQHQHRQPEKLPGNLLGSGASGPTWVFGGSLGPTCLVMWPRWWLTRSTGPRNRNSQNCISLFSNRYVKHSNSTCLRSAHPFANRVACTQTCEYSRHLDQHTPWLIVLHTHQKT